MFENIHIAGVWKRKGRSFEVGALRTRWGFILLSLSFSLSLLFPVEKKEAERRERREREYEKKRR